MPSIPIFFGLKRGISAVIEDLLVLGVVLTPSFAFAANTCLPLSENGPILEVPGKLPSVRASNGLFGASPVFNIDDDRFWAGKGPRSLQKAGVTALRFPGGEVADNYDWETNSVVRPDEFPREAKSEQARNQRTDYLEFLESAKKIGVKDLFFVVNVDSVFRDPGGIDANLQKYADKAAKWVKAVKDSGYKVKYWEIGNEVYLGRNAITAKEYSTVLNAYAKAMRQADSSIMIGATGPFEFDKAGFADNVGSTALKQLRTDATRMYRPCGEGKSGCSQELRDRSNIERPEEWWPTILQYASNSFDFAAIHQYRMSAWPKNGQRFRRTQDLEALKATLSQAKGKNVPVAITEWNIPEDRKGKMPSINRLLNVALYLGNHASSNVDYALYWPMRKGGKNWASLLDNDESLSPVGSLFSILHNVVSGADVAETLLSPSVYVLKINKSGVPHALLINRGKKVANVGLPGFANKSALISNYEADSDGGITLDSCAISDANDQQLRVGVPPKSVVVIKSEAN